MFVPGGADLRSDMNTRLLLPGLLVCLSLFTAHADDFSARVSKFTTREALRVGNTWRTDIPNCLKVTLRSSKEIPGIDAFFKAYFYDVDGKLLRAQTGPNALWTDTKRGTEEYSMPLLFKRGQLEPVYLALPADVKTMKTSS